MDPIVGEDGCGITDVCNTLEALDSYKIIIPKLHEIGLKLEVSPDQLHRIKTGLTLNTSTPFEALNEILVAWKAKYSDNARLVIFLDILRRCGLGEAADALKRRFNAEENHGHKNYVSPPVGVLDFLTSNHKVLVIRTRDKNVTVSKLEDTTTCIHTGDRHDFVKSLQNGNVCSFECNDDFNLTDVLNFIPAGSKCKIIIITEEGLTDVQKTCSKFAKVILVEDNIMWSQLSPSYQISMTEKYVKISGRRLTLKEFTRTAGRLEDGTFDEAALLDIINNREPHLDKSTLPDPIPYYIPRRISPRSFLNLESIFKTNSEKDIFMFSEIDAHELSKYTKSKITDSSTNQRRMAKPSVAHMVLNMASDFDEISKKHEGSTHWIMHDKGKFSLLRSSGRVDKIRKAIEHKRAQPEYTEEQFLNFVRTNSGIKTPVVISDTPGMGKTQLLGCLATQLISKGEIVMFGVLPRVLKALKAKIQEGLEMQEAVIAVVSSLGEQSKHVEKFLRRMIHNDQVHVNVMLDGFDEISSGDSALAKKVLQTINSFQKVQLWVTTRPHYLETLEDWLQVLGHNIQAFNPKDQLNCLVQYWNRQSIKQQQLRIVEEIRLTDFAKTCLDTLHKCMRDKDHGIAGVPLQCMLIGEVFSQEALNYANPENVQSVKLPPSISIRSITDLYTRLIEKKLDTFFERYPSSNHTRDQLKLVHMLLSIKLLFPEWEDSMKKFLENESHVEVDIQTILNVGLLQKEGADEKASFIHRTIAEYFTADFVVSRLGEKAHENFVIEFLSQVLVSPEYETTFQLHEYIGSAYTFSVFEGFTNTEVVYFLENLIQKHTPVLPTNDKVSQLLLHSCVAGNFVNLFHHFYSTKVFERHMDRVFSKELVFASIKLSDLSVIQKVCEMYEKVHGTCVRDISRTPLISRTSDSSKEEITPLHVAVKYREFPVVQFLINSCEYLDLLTISHSSTQQLISACVTGSYNNNVSMIENKILTLRLLHQINPQLFTLPIFEMTLPMLCLEIHISLLLELISLKANIYEEHKGLNILVRSAAYLTAEEYHTLVTHIPPNDLLFLLLTERIDYFEQSNRTIQRLMSDIDFLDICPETIRLFKTVGLDYNDVDRWGDSALDCAIKGHRSITTYEQLLECGAIVPPLHKRKWTVLHTALGANNFLAFQHFATKLVADESIKQQLCSAQGWSDLENLDIRKLGINLNIKDVQGNTVLHYLGRLNFINMKLLVDWGTNINATNKKGRNVLEECFAYLKSKCISKKEYLLGIGGVETLELLESRGAIQNQEMARKVLEILDVHNEDNAARELATKIRCEYLNPQIPICRIL